MPIVSLSLELKPPPLPVCVDVVVEDGVDDSKEVEESLTEVTELEVRAFEIAVLVETEPGVVDDVLVGDVGFEVPAVVVAFAVGEATSLCRSTICRQNTQSRAQLPRFAKRLRTNRNHSRRLRVREWSPYGICRVCQVSNASGCPRSYVVLWKCLTPILWSLGNFVALVAFSHNDFLNLAKFYLSRKFRILCQKL